MIRHWKRQRHLMWKRFNVYQVCKFTKQSFVQLPFGRMNFHVFVLPTGNLMIGSNLFNCSTFFCVHDLFDLVVVVDGPSASSDLFFEAVISCNLLLRDSARCKRSKSKDSWSFLYRIGFGSVAKSGIDACRAKLGIIKTKRYDFVRISCFL